MAQQVNILLSCIQSKKNSNPSKHDMPIRCVHQRMKIPFWRVPLFSLLHTSAIALLTLSGCATSTATMHHEALDYRGRSVTQVDGSVQVSASALSARESHAVYGAPLARKGIQPVWIQVENSDDQAYWLMYPGIDPDFFPASEAAESFRQTGEDGSSSLEQRFHKLAFKNPVLPGATASGFVLTNLDEGVKMVQVDLVANNQHKSFSFLTLVPGFRADYKSRESFTRQIYNPADIVDYADDDTFREALEALPCCVTNKKGNREGDPLNLVVVGGLDDAFPAFVRRGWRPTEKTWLGSVTKMMKSGLTGDRYPYAPISNLYLFGRPQDLALQKVRDNVHQRNHLRVWRSPMRFRGKPVWVGQISRDIGTRLTIHSPFLMTHKIDPDVDEARIALVEDMAYSYNLASVGFVKGIGATLMSDPRRNLTNDPYYTDGARAVLIFDSHPRALSDIKFLQWEWRKGGFIEQTLQEQP